MLRDRRGVTSLMFGVGAVGAISLAGLATEGGTWYLERRHGQNAADAAAIAGALALAGGETNAAAITDATSIATANLYTSGTSNGTTTTVAVSNVTYNNQQGVQVVVTRSQPRLFSALFLTDNISISETAVAVIAANGSNACVLGLSGGLSFAGSTSINASNCALASNAKGPNSISFTGNKATVTNGLLIAEGGCSNCGNAPGYATYQPPTTNPFKSIYDPTTGTGLTMPSFTGSQCLSIPTVRGTAGAPTTLTPWTQGSQVAYCGTGNGNGSTLKVTGGAYLNFLPGTYFFQNASLDFNGGAVECTTCTPGGAGVTIILTGTSASKIGTISVGGNANVTLNAPVTNTWCHAVGTGCNPNTSFDGVLFYMSNVAQPTNGKGNAPVSLSGNGTVQLTGGMYFPTVNVTYSGNVAASNAAVACTVIVAEALDFTGNSTLSIAGCGADGTPVPLPQSVQLAQ
ncbi:MAG: pilus assembly protein TadG-related protein [Rhodopila sp.]|nr:pilus assembly protein TadG-related protein [Rhodopila sp.]